MPAQPAGDVLPDLLLPGLDLVICGSAAGRVSAAVGAYYAGPGNKFWPVLHETGLTPRRLAPAEFPLLLAFGIGLTDMCKTASGADADLPAGSDDLDGFRARIAAARPRAVAFNGMRAARILLGGGPVAYGRQPDRLSGAALFVLPSTSGMARRWWDPAPWQAMAAFVRG